MADKIYYKGRNGLEYAEYSDAVKYGGGAVGKRVHQPVKKWEPIYDELSVDDVPTGAPVTNTPNPQVDAPTAVSDFDGMDKEQLKTALKTKGYTMKGNPSEATLRERLKVLSN